MLYYDILNDYINVERVGKRRYHDRIECGGRRRVVERNNNNNNINIGIDITRYLVEK